MRSSEHHDLQHRVGERRRRVGAMLVGLVLVGFSAGFAGTAASAGTASSGVGNYGVYNNQATITTSPGTAKASTMSGKQTGNAAAGYLGARGRLFTNGSTVSIYCEGTTLYNSVSAHQQYAYSCTGGGSRTWNSYGVSRFYNGSGYNDVMTFNSPNQTS